MENVTVMHGVSRTGAIDKQETPCVARTCTDRSNYLMSSCYYLCPLDGDKQIEKRQYVWRDLVTAWLKSEIEYMELFTINVDQESLFSRFRFNKLWHVSYSESMSSSKRLALQCIYFYIHSIKLIDCVIYNCTSSQQQIRGSYFGRKKMPS